MGLYGVRMEVGICGAVWSLEVGICGAAWR